MMVGDAFGTELHSAVDKAFRALQSPFDGQFKIGVLFCGGEEVVFFLLFVELSGG